VASDRVVAARRAVLITYEALNLDLAAKEPTSHLLIEILQEVRQISQRLSRVEASLERGAPPEVSRRVEDPGL
jgi:hypothetical protein